MAGGAVPVADQVVSEVGGAVLSETVFRRLYVLVAGRAVLYLVIICLYSYTRWVLSPISVISDIGLSLISELPISD